MRIRLLPKAVPLFCQPWDRGEIVREGFVDVRPVQEEAHFREAAGEPTVYWVGDSVWSDEAAWAVARYEPRATVIAVHLEALDHGTVSRAELREAAEAAGIPSRRLRIPRDGEEIEL